MQRWRVHLARYPTRMRGNTARTWGPWPANAQRSPLDARSRLTPAFSRGRNHLECAGNNDCRGARRLQRTLGGVGAGVPAAPPPELAEEQAEHDSDRGGPTDHTLPAAGPRHERAA
jgi:hypothetical protein